MKRLLTALIAISSILITQDLSAQSFPRMGGERGQTVYGLQGSGNVYGFRKNTRNVTGVKRERQIFTSRRYSSNSLTGVSSGNRLFGRNSQSRTLFSAGGANRRFF
jgi:hypothetical protein